MLEGDGGALFPPLRFSPVESGVYRGGFPAVRNFPFLGTLDLRTVVSLAPEVTPDLQSWCEAEQVDLKLFPVQRYSPDSNWNLTAALLGEILGVILDATQLPLYVHCLDGIQATGVVVMSLRKVLLWPPSPIAAEYCRFAEAERPPVFVERMAQDFNEVVLAAVALPDWLRRVWGSSAEQRPRTHPSVRIRYKGFLGADGAPMEATALAASQSAGQDEVWRDTEGRVSAAHRSMMMIGGANIQSQIQDNGSFGALAASLALPIDETGTIQLSRTLQALDLYGLQ